MQDIARAYSSSQSAPGAVPTRDAPQQAPARAASAAGLRPGKPPLPRTSRSVTQTSARLEHSPSQPVAQHPPRTGSTHSDGRLSSHAPHQSLPKHAHGAAAAPSLSGHASSHSIGTHHLQVPTSADVRRAGTSENSEGTRAGDSRAQSPVSLAVFDAAAQPMTALLASDAGDYTDRAAAAHVDMHPYQPGPTPEAQQGSSFLCMGQGTGRGQLQGSRDRDSRQPQVFGASAAPQQVRTPDLQRCVMDLVKN